MRSGSATGRSCTGGVAAFRGDRLRDFGGTLEGADGGGGEGSEGRLEAFRCRKKEDPEGGGEPVLVEVDSEDAAIAEVPFVSNETRYGKREGIIRYIAIRRASPDALGVYDDESPHRPDKPAHAIRVLITNNPALGEGRADGLGPEPMAAQPVLKLLNGRCGDAEQAHDALKNGLAGGTMPGGRLVDVRRSGVQPPCTDGMVDAGRGPGPGPAASGPGCKRTRRVLLIHAGRLVERGRQLILKLRKAGTEELQAALRSLDERPTAPG